MNRPNYMSKAFNVTTPQNSDKSISNNRILQLGSEVNDSTVNGLISSILTWNQEDVEKEETVKDFKRKPINLYISSYGGECYAGLALINAIKTSVTPVHAYCIGHAMSMAFVILCACHKRFGYKYSTFMYHQVSSWAHGKLLDMKEDIVTSQRLQDLIDEVILAHTGIDKKKIKEVNQKKFDWYLSVEEAKKIGIIDKIIS